MTSARPRQCVGSLRWISLFLLLASTIVESQVQTTVEVVTETGVATEQTVTLTSTAPVTTVTRPTTTFATISTISVTSISPVVTPSPTPTSLIPSNTAPKPDPVKNAGPPKVVIIAASLGGAGVLAAVCMGIYYGCCRSSQRKKKKIPIVSNEFFAPMAVPVREPRLPVLPPTPVSHTPPKEPHMSRPEMDGESSWPLTYSRGASPAPPPVGWTAAGGDYGPEYKHDSYRGPSPQPPPVYHGGYLVPQGYVEGTAYGDPGALRNPEWGHNREEPTGRVSSATAELPSGTQRYGSGRSGRSGRSGGSGRGLVEYNANPTPAPTGTAELPS